VNRIVLGFLCALAVVGGTTSPVACCGAEYWLADRASFPGGVWSVDTAGRTELSYRRQAKADPAFPSAITKISQVAAAPDGAFYFVSGLDGYVIGLIDNGQHEVLAFEVEGQIRDIACGGEEHVVYYSVVPTPQEGEPLADGVIYRRDLWQGEPAEVATIRQADVGGNWWGTFCVRDGVITIVTTDFTPVKVGQPAIPSRLFQLTGGTPEPIESTNTRRILGIEADANGFLIADGTRSIVRTVDFATFSPALFAPVTASDVTARWD
jgi:hypothetical protein